MNFSKRTARDKQAVKCSIWNNLCSFGASSQCDFRPEYVSLLFIDLFSKEAVLLCGGPAHLLKRDMNLLQSARKHHNYVHVSHENELVPLNWNHILTLHEEYCASDLKGLPSKEPLLSDNYGTLNEWGKMKVPTALAVYSPRVTGALIIKASSAKSLGNC